MYDIKTFYDASHCLNDNTNSALQKYKFAGKFSVQFVLAG